MGAEFNEGDRIRVRKWDGSRLMGYREATVRGVDGADLILQFAGERIPGNVRRVPASDCYHPATREHRTLGAKVRNGTATDAERQRFEECEREHAARNGAHR